LSSCNTQIPGICAPHLCSCPPAQTERDMPHNPTPHCRQGELNHEHPLVLVRRKPKWCCKSNHALLALLNNLSPLPNQTLWNVFQFSYAVGMQVTSIFRMRDFTLDEWRQLPKAGNLVGHAGQPMSCLWEWTLSYRTPHLQPKSASSLGLPRKSERGTMVEENKSKLGAYLAQSWPLDRQLRWPQTPTPPK
jgi:hypothetical protein